MDDIAQEESGVSMMCLDVKLWLLKRKRGDLRTLAGCGSKWKKGVSQELAGCL